MPLPVQSCCAVALLLTIGALAVAGVRADVYVKQTNTDAPQHNIVNTGTQNIDVLKSQCTANPNCKGFNSNGWLKDDVTSTAPTANVDLYVRHPQTAEPKLIPAPQTYTHGNEIVSLIKSFNIVTDTPNDDINEAIQRYHSLIFQHKQHTSHPAGNVLTTLTISIEDLNPKFQLDTDESYSLYIPNDGSTGKLSAKTYYGALRGLETFSQLVEFHMATQVYYIRNAPWNISDAPRFLHRGILVDTSRHFQPIRTLKTFIDSMSYAKLNVFHWHMSDSQSFPFQSLTYPKLWNSSYSNDERYTQDDVIELVEYARERGVRVMVEFDVPGHAEAWCIGYPEVCPSTSCASPLDPSKNATYDLFAGLFGELTGKQQYAGLFPDDFFHLGGDEVDTSCWASTPHIQEWLKQNNFTEDDAYMYIVERAHDIVSSYGRAPVNWEEVFNKFGSKLDKKTIIHIWLDHATLASVVAAGYRAILSNQDVWYLDHLDTTWQQFYLNDPLKGITDPSQQALVLGGETCMWGETVDPSDLFNTVWPRAAAAAERLWSPASYTDTEQFLPRLEWFRCLLTRRGIDSAPTNNDKAREAPPRPGGCYEQ